jgi:RNA polymerase sigma factor (sigma-70 family)
MQSMGDSELLREYALRNSEEAFATLVSRHIDMVYSAALRHVANHHLAEEITQAVFVILSRKAATLSPATVLAGWLFRATCLTAANYLRAEIRRAHREQESFMQSNLNEDRADLGCEIAPMLNDAIAALSERDRNAVVLRFLQGKDYKSVAAAIGGTEEAAQMRVGRALEKLRKIFSKRGLVVSSTALGGVMAAQGTQAAPVGLAAAVTVGALQGVALTASTVTLVKGTLKVMAWTKLKIAVSASAVLLLAYQYHQNGVWSQHLTDAREELQAEKNAVAAQESEIAELELQANAIQATRREQGEALAQIRARRAANGLGAQTKTGASPPTTLLSAMLADPGAKESLLEELAGNARKRWEPAVKELKLKSDDAEKLYRIAAGLGLKNLEAIVDFTQTKITAAEAVQAGAQADLEATNQERLLLGEENLSKLEEAGRSFPSRSLAEQFDHQLGFFALNSEQRVQLRDLFASVPNNVAEGLAGDFTVRQLVYADELERRFTQEKEANRQILEKAGQFLDQNNVGALALMQASNLAAHERTALQILRKL